MKRLHLFKNSIISFSILVFSMGVFAEGIPEGYIEATDQCIDHQHFIGDDLEYAISGEHDWLIEELFTPQEIKNATEVGKSFRPHLQDSYKVFPHPDDIIKSNTKTKKSWLVKGRITYLSLFPKKYRYLVTKLSPNHYQIKVKVFFKNATVEDLDNFKYYFERAEEKWNQNFWHRDFKYSFRFKVVQDRRDAFFAVNVKDQTRGPYDTNWGRNWTGTVIAHELGHMMGLGDEYEIISSKAYCLRKSIMCSSWYGKPMKHHYYHILRRLMDSP